jgi:hypothetical protein
MERITKRAPRSLARKTDTKRAQEQIARWNQYSCAELSAAMDLPLRQLDDTRTYGDLAHHMDLPSQRRVTPQG